MARCQWWRDFPRRNQRDLDTLAGAETLHSASNVSYRLVQHFNEIWFWMGIKFGSEIEALSEPEQPISTREVWDRCDLIGGISWWVLMDGLSFAESKWNVNFIDDFRFIFPMSRLFSRTITLNKLKAEIPKQHNLLVKCISLLAGSVQIIFKIKTEECHSVFKLIWIFKSISK